MNYAQTIKKKQKIRTGSAAEESTPLGTLREELSEDKRRATLSVLQPSCGDVVRAE